MGIISPIARLRSTASLIRIYRKDWAIYVSCDLKPTHATTSGSQDLLNHERLFCQKLRLAAGYRPSPWLVHVSRLAADESIPAGYLSLSRHQTRLNLLLSRLSFSNGDPRLSAWASSRLEDVKITLAALGKLRVVGPKLFPLFRRLGLSVLPVLPETPNSTTPFLFASTGRSGLPFFIDPLLLTLPLDQTTNNMNK